jgi:hypothetical protein
MVTPSNKYRKCGPEKIKEKADSKESNIVFSKIRQGHQ